MATPPSAFGEIARVGPIRRQAFKVRDLLCDPERTGYVAVALPEEMPVNETLEYRDEIEKFRGGLDAVRGVRHAGGALLERRHRKWQPNRVVRAHVGRLRDWERLARPRWRASPAR
mgnify:CR=1 FL=1